MILLGVSENFAIEAEIAEYIVCRQENQGKMIFPRFSHSLENVGQSRGESTAKKSMSYIPMGERG